MRLLGIDLGPGEVRVACAERLFGAVRLTGLERIPVDDPAALPSLLAATARSRPQAVLATVPATLATHRVLVLPFRDRRRLRRAAPMELLGQLPVEPDDALVACEPLGPVPGGTSVLAVIVRRADLEAHLAPLAAAGLVPTRVELGPLPAWNLLPDGSDDMGLLVADGERSAVAVRRGGRLAALRALGAAARDEAALAAEVRWSFAALGGAPPVIVLAGGDAGPGLAAAVAAATGARVVPIADATPMAFPARDSLAAAAVAAGLVAGAGRRAGAGIALVEGGRHAAGSLRRVAVLAALAVALGALDVALVRRGLLRRDALLVGAIEAEARAALPGVTLVAPREQLAAAAATAVRRRARLGGEVSVLELMRELSARVPATLRLDVDELAVDRDGMLLHGRAESFDAVDVLRHALAGSPLLTQVAAGDTRTTVDGRGVEFQLRAARRPPGANS